MPCYFAAYWTIPNCDKYERGKEEGEPLTRAASVWFEEPYLHIGDVLYPMTIRQGKLYLIGRLEVGRFLTASQASECFGSDALDKLYVVARPGSEKPKCFRRQLEDMLVRDIRFIDHRGKEVRFKYEPQKGEFLKQQTLRGVRELTRASAERLNSVIDADSDM